MTDEKMRRFLESNSIAGLPIADLDRYLTGATETQLRTAREQMLANNDSRLAAVVMAEQHRRLELDRHDTLMGRLGALDESVRKLDRKEWQTIVFWIVVATFFVTVAALFRDTFGWTVPGSAHPEPTLIQPASDMTHPAIRPETKDDSTPSPNP